MARRKSKTKVSGGKSKLKASNVSSSSSSNCSTLRKATSARGSHNRTLVAESIVSNGSVMQVNNRNNTTTIEVTGELPDIRQTVVENHSTFKGSRKNNTFKVVHKIGKERKIRSKGGQSGSRSHRGHSMNKLGKKR